jgi:VIT1/CCC1 family predicted Fe2+/Mn2+ transporter
VAESLVEVIHKNPDLALATHAREELGLDPEDGLGSPWGAAISSFVMFSLGAIIPLLPFLIGSGGAARLAAILAGAFTLFLVGSLMSILTGKRPIRSGLRMLVIGAAAASVTYAVGRAFHVGGVG